MGAGYQIIQSKIAVGSGGLTGKGFKRHSKLFGVSSQKNILILYFIYSEEYGFVGSLILLLLYAIIIFRIISIGSISRSFFSKLFCYGFAIATFIYIAVIMCMVLGLLPIVGSPLSIMSYGGSSMLATMIGFSIVMSSKIHHKQHIS